MGDRFREVEETFALLRRKFHERTISKREYIDTLKQLRIKDDEGRFWMIGAQTGQWYCHDGGGWTQAKPPSLLERKAICISCGFENDLEAEFCARCGSRPGEKEQVPPPVSVRGDVALPVAGPRDLVLRSCHTGSFFWFFGAMGLFAGMLAGLMIGVTSLFPGLVAGLPGFFADIQGKLPGGLVFTVLGGVAGFVVFGAGGALTALVSNGVMSLVGGIRFQADETSPEGPERTGD